MLLVIIPRCRDNIKPAAAAPAKSHPPTRESRESRRKEGGKRGKGRKEKERGKGREEGLKWRFAAVDYISSFILH
jgi:hypothetical protein